MASREYEKAGLRPTTKFHAKNRPRKTTSSTAWIKVGLICKLMPEIAIRETKK